jgi:hypothetical protein
MELGRASGLANKMIDVYFSSENSIAERRRRPLAKELFQKVKEALNSDTCGKLTLEGWRDNLPEEISSITIHDSPSLSRPLWQIAGGGQTIEDCVNEIQTTVNKKHEKLERYRKTCTECWLVIVSDVWERSDIEPNLATRTHTYTSCFDRTYFMMYGLKKVWQLTTQPPA